MKRIHKTAIAAILGMILLFTGCLHPQPEDPNDIGSETVTVIPVMLRMDGETGNQPDKELVDAFNEAYAGKYRVEVDWYVGEEAGYRERIKLLNATDQLPAVFTDVGVLPDFYRLLVENDRLVNIRPYLEADDHWSVSFPDYILSSCTEKDGAMYLVPITSPVFLSGVFYNKTIFSEAGIEEFPETWEDFFRDCEAIKNKGYIPLGLHTTGTAWTTMLFATAYMGRNADGFAFLEQQYPENYNTPAMYDMLEMTKQLFAYGSENAIDGDYDDAYRDFIEGKVAMFPNGQWMIAGLYDETLVDASFADNLGFALFPNQTAVGSVQASGWAVAKNYPQEVIDGAIAFLKFRTQREQEYRMGQVQPENVYPLMYDFFMTIGRAETVVPNYQIKWNSIIQEEVLLLNLPQYLRDEISAEELVEKMNQAAIRFNYERGLGE